MDYLMNNHQCENKMDIELSDGNDKNGLQCVLMVEYLLEKVYIHKQMRKKCQSKD